MRKIIISVLVLMLIACKQSSVDFKIVEVMNAFDSPYSVSVFPPDKKYYKISTNENMSNSRQFYPIDVKYKSLSDTITAIGKLLDFENDERLCAIPIACWNESSSQLYFGKEKLYSIQLEALFIINQLYYKKFYIFSPYPVLLSSDKQIASVGGPLIKEAYTSYRIWFKDLKESDFRKDDFEKPNPLAHAKVKWY